MHPLETESGARLRSGADKLKEGWLDDAVDDFTSALAVESLRAQAHRGRASARFRLKDIQGAEQDFRAARALDPDEPENGMGLALCLAVQGKVYEAVDAYGWVLARRPDFAPAYVQLGLLHFKIGAIARGRDFMREALKRRPAPDQRRIIETALAGQDVLDKGRYYRPDFNRLKAHDAFDGFGRGLRRGALLLKSFLFHRGKENFHDA